jgi:hypothetical protein
MSSLKPTITRREFLLTAAAAGAALILDRPTFRRVQAAPRAVPAHRVVHAHSPAATFWDYATGWC